MEIFGFATVFCHWCQSYSTESPVPLLCYNETYLYYYCLSIVLLMVLLRSVALPIKCMSVLTSIFYACSERNIQKNWIKHCCRRCLICVWSYNCIYLWNIVFEWRNMYSFNTKYLPSTTVKFWNEDSCWKSGYNDGLSGQFHADDSFADNSTADRLGVIGQ